MEEIAACENTENPKEAIKRLAEEAAARRKTLRMDEDDYTSAAKKEPESVKTQKTLKLGKQPEITVKMTKSSASSKKATSAKKQFSAATTKRAARS